MPLEEAGDAAVVVRAIACARPRALTASKAIPSLRGETLELEPAQPQAPLLAWLSVHEGLLN